jgi:two-component SAPR family response regulator
LSGPAHTAVQRALALELSTSEFAHHLDVSLAGQAAVRAAAAEMPERLTAHDYLDQALPVVRAHHRDQQQAFTVLGCDGLLSARTGVDTAAAWTPHVVMADGLTDEDAPALAELIEMAAAQPRSATALITSGPLPVELPDTTWVLNTDPAAAPLRLPLQGVELDCSLQAFSDDDWSAALEILERSRAEAVPEMTYQDWFAAPPAPEVGGDSDSAARESDSPIGNAWAPQVVALSKPTATADDPGQVPSLAHFASYEDPEPDESADVADDMALLPGDDAGPEEESAEGDGAPAPLSKAPVPAQQNTPALHVRLPEPDPATEAEGAVPSRTSHPPVIGPGITSAGPVVRVLGPVDVVGARGEVKESSRRRTNTELAAWLVLHPGRDHQPLDAAMWPTKETQTEGHTKYRNVCVSRLRSWLGQDDTGRPFLPKLPPSADARYSLSPAVTSDWHQFLVLVDAASATSGPHATQALREALELVRGRPFMSDDRRRYRWAEHLAQVMLSKIVLTAEDLAQRCLEDRDPRGAVWAAAKGLDVAPEVESLYRILFQAYAALGDHDSLERAAEALEDFNMKLGTETEDETIAILNELMAKA